MSLRKLGLIFTILLAGLLPALAQGNGGSLHGVVIVPSGAPIPQATVSVEGAAGGQAATTNEHGQYTLNGLAPGDYKLRISAPGFDPFEVQVSVGSGSTQEFDAVLRETPRTVEAAPAAAQGGEAAAGNPAAAAEQTATPGQAAPQAPVTTVAAPETLSVKAPKGKAALFGIVTDQSNAVISNASAVATGPAGPVTVTANARGEYVLNGLAPGTYKLTVSAPGFAPFDADITLTANQALQIDAQLQPPVSKTEVNVEASNAAQVQTENAQVEGTITEKEVLKTGLNGRNFTQLIALAPGVSNQTSQDEAKVGVVGSVKYSVNGGRVEYNNFDVDGSDVLNAGLNGAESTLMVYPSLDAIQEVKVLTSNYGAMYGRTASGTVLVTTKSGTPQFHGDVYEFFRNEFLNARGYFDPQGKPPLYRRQDFGFTIGGPLYIPGVFNTQKKKTFFFWSEEFRLEKSPVGPGNTPGDFNSAVPTVAERNGNFSDVCPFAQPKEVVAFTRQAFPDCPQSANGLTFPGNQLVDAQGNNLINTNSAALLNALIPLPNSSNGCTSTLAGQTNVQTGTPLFPCYVAAISPPTYWREELGRIDHNFTDNVRASFRYIHDSWDTTTPTPLWGYLQTAYIHEQSYPSVQNRLNGPGTSLVARLTYTISPSLLNEFVASYVNSSITLKNLSGPGVNINAPLPFPRGSSEGIGYIFNNGFGGKLPGLIIGGSNAAYGGLGFAVDTSYMPWEHSSPTYAIADNVSKVIGTHTLQLGVQAVQSRRSETNGAIGAATGDVQGLLTFSNFGAPGNSGNAFANFLANFQNQGATGPIISSYTQDSAQHKYYNDYNVVEPYIQDDWRLNHRLTLNLGVRLSLFGNYHELNNNAFNWEPGAFSQSLAASVLVDPNRGFLETASGHHPISLDEASVLGTPVTNGLVQCGVNGVPSSCMSNHLFNPAPRVGFAWDPQGNGKTSIRGGYGIFYEHGTPKEANTGSLEGGPPLVQTMTQANPSAYVGIGGGVAYPLSVAAIPTKTVWPYVQQWSLSVQREFPKDMVGTIAYVGSKGTHLSAELQLNQLTPPPIGSDNGISLNGNPYNPGEPITLQDCASYNSINGFFTVGKNFTNTPIVVTPSQQAWKNLAAACYNLNNTIPQPNSLRTFAPGLAQVLSLQNIADSQYHGLQTTLRRTRGPLTVGVSYTYSHSFDDASDRSDASFVNSANIKSNWASSNFDQRHLLNVNYIYDFPKLSGMMERWLWASADQPGSAAQSNSGVLRALLDGWEYSGITTFQSGTPFSVINGGSNSGISVLDNAGIANGAGSGSYPDIVGNPRAPLTPGINRQNTQSVGPLLYNPAAFAAPQGLTFGDAGRNFMTNPHRINFDMTLLKNFKITEGSSLEFRVEGFNIFNHTQFRVFDPNIGNTDTNTISCYGGPNFTAAGGYTQVLGAPFGAPPIFVDCTTGYAFLRPVNAHRPRTLQLGLKYTF